MPEHGPELSPAMPTSSSKKHRDDSGNSVSVTDLGRVLPESEDLAQLVWKYFEEEIREALAEVDASIRSRQ